MEAAHRLKSLPAWMADPETEELVAALSAGDAEPPRFVGGCVRDALINRKVYDIDLATPLVPDAVMALLQKAKIKYAKTGVEHGTVTAIVNKQPFEVTTLRRDIETDGRHAKVTFTDNWCEDAARRDFTVNALFCDLEGNIYDYFGGVKDLHAGLIRFIGDAEERITEDVLRILRFFRFYAHYGRGAADARALEACGRMAEKIPALSQERITYEFLRLLEAERAPGALRYMEESGVMRRLTEQNPAIDVLERLITLEAAWDTDFDAMRRLAALFSEDVPLLRLSRVQEKHLARLRDQDWLKKIWPEMTGFEIRQCVFDMGNDILRDLIQLAAARAAENSVREKYRGLYLEATSCRLPRFPVTGKDVIKLGVPEGKELGVFLKQVETWWRDRDFRSGRTECLEYLKSCVENEGD
ncbi:MAG: CCA tRNA nucleotidyltransferase [Micavibrio sp.]|nr:MAG: CCA tRNA nucleotidyltransferase [Micavibrio sp.]